MIIIILLITLLIATESMEKPKCWRGGSYNETGDTCECRWGWKNIKNPGGICQSKSCGTGIGPNKHDRCECKKKEFSGIGCFLCEEDRSCEILFDQKYCRKGSLVSYENMNVECDVKEAPSKNMTGLIGSKITLQNNGVGLGKEIGFPNVVFMQVWNATNNNNNGGFEGETFWCNFYNVSMTQIRGVGDNVKYSSEKTWCECNLGILGSNGCEEIPNLKQIVDHMRGPAYYKCESKSGMCMFNHSDFPSIITWSNCKSGECTNIPPSKHPSHHPSGLSIVEIIGISAGGFVAGIFVVCACVYILCGPLLCAFLVFVMIGCSGLFCVYLNYFTTYVRRSLHIQQTELPRRNYERV